MTSITSTETIAHRKARKWFEDHRGSLCRSNSKAYSISLAKIARSAQPQRKAEAILKQLAQAKSEGDLKAIRQCANGDKGGHLPDALIAPREVTTADLDCLSEFVRHRFGGKLDAGHHALFSRMEAAIFAGTLSRQEFVRLGLSALQIAVFDPQKGTWTLP